MRNKPKISVIMSVYNGMPFLKEAVESVLEQTYKNFEFIIVDDGSTDNTWTYLQSLKDKQSLRSSSASWRTAGLKRIKLIKNKKNLSLAASLNKALKHTRGDYIARMDADDVSKPERLATQMDFMKKNPAVDICGSFVEVINEGNKVIGKIEKPTTDHQIKKELFWLTPLLHPTWFAKREVFEKLNGYDQKWDYVEDFEFLTRAKDYKMANIPEYLLLFRSQATRRSQKTIEKIYRNSLKLRLKIFKEHKLGIGYLPILFRSYISTYFFPTRLKVILNKLIKYA